MTKDEFWTWFLEHCEHFTALGTWFGNLRTDQAEPGIITQAVVLEKWQGVLATVDIVDAREATRAMFADTEDVFFDRHPAHIRAIALKLAAPRKIRERSASQWAQPGYEPTFTCRKCNGRGFRSIVRAESIESIKRGEEGVIYVGAIPCGGDLSRQCQYANERFPQDLRRYSPTRCCLAEQPGMDGKVMSDPELREYVKRRLAGDREWDECDQPEADADDWEPPMSQEQAIAGSKADAMKRAARKVGLFNKGEETAESYT